MQSASWITLFRRIPTNLHDGLVLTISTGGEVVVQKIIKLDVDVVVIRGRMAATHDAGRVMVLPFSQLIAINFVRRLSEQDVTNVFGQNAQSFAADIELQAPTTEEQAEKEAQADAEVKPAAAHKPTAPKPAAGKPAMPSKADLLAKLRSRLADGAKGPGSLQPGG